MSANYTDVIIYHNPECGTSRNTLAMIRNAGVVPHVIEYLKTPPSRTLLLLLVALAAPPILINRPIVLSPKGVRLCGPAETVLDLLPPQKGAFTKEDGEKITDTAGNSLA